MPEHLDDPPIEDHHGLLDGLRVLDLSVWRPMPHATQILADLGAEVLKVEPPGGDPMRAYPAIFASVARGKRSIVLDLRVDEDRARALSLAAEADVVCEGWRPGVADRLGMGHAAVVAVNPQVIYCSLTGYGQHGPRHDLPGHDLNFQAIGGALAARRSRDDDPRVPRLPVADLESGTLSALLICAAWARRCRTGVGERIDVAMADVIAWWVGTEEPSAVDLDPDGDAGTDVAAGARQAVGSPGYGVFRTADHRWIALGVLSEQRLWDATCAALGIDELVGIDFAARSARTADVNGILAAAIGALDRHVALEQLERHGAPVSPVLEPSELSDHVQFRARAFHVDTTAGPVAALPAQLDSGGRVVSTVLPAAGAHPDGFSPRHR